MDTYDWADSAINAAPQYSTGFSELLATGPYLVSGADRRQYDTRLPLIRAYQQTALHIFRAALAGDADPVILHWLINETPESLGVSFHRRLEDRHFTLPVFFRTDEVRPGRIAEMQCPGSLWGELQLAFERTAGPGHYPGDGSLPNGRVARSPGAEFAAQLTRFLREPPVVHHHLDSSSAPAGMRYFMERTRPGVRYWSIDPDVRAIDCNFIRHHSFAGLWADLYLPARLAKAGQGLAFDLPPYILFDQKATQVLPFWSLTRAAFSDDIRNLFPFTTAVLPEGIEMQDGGCMTIEEFSRLQQSRRSYFAKYAGADWTRNWGSRAVYRLSNLGSGACLEFLRKCLRGYERGEIWLLQEEEFQEDEIEYLTRDGRVHCETLRGKFSGFYGPGGCIGVLAQHRRHFKVHGQPETVVSYVMAGSEDPPAI